MAHAQDHAQKQWIGFGDSEHIGERPVVDAHRLGLWFFLATVVMLFAGFTSAILVRRTSADWQAIPLLPLLRWNTLVLLASSVTLERVRTLVRRDRRRQVRTWLAVTALLGVLFLAGQMGAWEQYRALGLFLSSNPHSSFFYILSGVHGAHLAGGLLGLGYLLARPGRVGAVNLCATYWHFLGGLWLYLLVMLFVV